MLIAMPFPNRLAETRKERGLTQEALGESVGLTKLQIYRYEKGTSQPTLDVLKKIAVTLHVSLDELVFDATERDPTEDLKLRFELIQGMSEEDQKTIKSLLDGMILKHQTKMTMGNFN
jgi:transcriptional regulator with XRE-family HTH domain